MKKNKKLSVTIGIPAYNEEANIRLLLERLLQQKLSPQVKLQEVIVISDGSTDRTVEIVRSFKNPLIKIIESKGRVGQNIRQNQLISAYRGDILIIIEADTVPYDLNTINSLVVPFIGNKSKKLGMVVGRAVSLPAKNLIEKIESHAEKIKSNLFSEWRNGDNLYSTGGHAMKALSRNFAFELTFPTDAPEDSYTYFRLKQLGLQMIVQPNAKAYVKRASNLKDYIRRNKKFVGGKETLKKYFPEALVNREFTPPINLFIKHLHLEFFNSPMLTVLYLMQFLLVRFVNFRAKELNPLYEPAKSTKKLLIGEEII